MSLAAELAAGPALELLDAQQAVIAALTTLSRFGEPVLAEPRAKVAVPRTSVAEPRLPDEESVSHDLKLSKNTPTDFLSPPSANRGSANQARPSRIREEPATSGTEIDELIQPLAALADRCGLIGVTDRAGLHNALSPYSTDQIRRAVSQVTRMTKNGKISSPLGWLIAAAGRGDPDLFTSAPSGTQHPPAHNPPGRQSDLGDAAAEEALAQADTLELARLDDHIRTDPHFAPILSRILAQPEALHAARLAALRALQEAS